MEVWQVALTAFALGLAVVLTKIGLDLATKAINKKQQEIIDKGLKASNWLKLATVLTQAARTAVGYIEQTAVKAYKEKAGEGAKLTKEEQEAAWKQAGMMMLSSLPADILSQIVDIWGTSEEAQLAGLRAYIENEISERKNP